jgi:crossover junction endodeoxyribonuclease RuvC
MIYLGIDPGFADMGFGVVEIARGGKEKCLAYGTVKTPKSLPMPERLLQLHDDLTALIKKYRPAAAGIEKLFFQNNAKTAMDVAEARGVIRLALAQAGMPTREFTPAQIKIAVCGHGGAEKLQVQKMVQKMLALPRLPRPDDAADALAIALAAAWTK